MEQRRNTTNDNREVMQRTTYYSTLQYNPSVSIRCFAPLIKRTIKTGQRTTTEEPLPFIGVGYTLFVTPAVTKNVDGLLTLTLEWEDRGETYKQEIPILQEESNLIPDTYIYYFLCPYGGYKSRKLYYIANRFRSRRSFRNRYSSQSRSHRQRVFTHLHEPYRKYGKEKYRGKLTPYGRRCLRYEEKECKAILDSLTMICSKFK